ncbi:hypothetical protein A8926_0027 [Saccharopolyspora spinosa]|uniref:Uncharacterized protein n=1 Tax=Saccharopolyspora spinosa TaxID=60894 RepID=A0A2N3XPH1_SACSN|nr:hypothetical protein A8926_0027 [Saccharopolyspora spinosa]
MSPRSLRELLLIAALRRRWWLRLDGPVSAFGLYGTRKLTAGWADDHRKPKMLRKIPWPMRAWSASPPARPNTK